MKLSVVVLSKNNDYTIRPCLSSILAAQPTEKEVIVVDASNDEGKRYLKTLAERRLIKLVEDEGKGIGRARNMGAEVSSGDIICYADADTIVAPNHFLKVMEIFEKPEVGVVSPIPKYCFKGMNNIQNLEHMLREQRRRRGDEHKSGYSYFAEGVFLSVRRQVWERIKFWEKVRYGADDWDYSMRVIRAGWKIYAVETNSVHIPRPTLRALFKEQFGWGAGMKAFFKMHPQFADYAYRGRKLRMFTGNVWLITLMSRSLAPSAALKYAVPAKCLTLVPFYIFRQYSFLAGVVFG
ncbi:MAG: glycosyltransferase [Candidatus Bathyarchaeia archaeon]